MTRHSSRARAALAHLAETDPAIAALALWCTHRDAEGETRTEGETICYGLDFEALALPEQVGLAAHHVLHVAFRHPARSRAMAERLGPDYDAALFTLAADALMNEALLQAGHALPRPAVTASELLAAALKTPERPEAVLAEWDVERLFMALARGPAGAGGEDRAGLARAYAARRGFSDDLKPGGGEGESREDADWRGRVARAMEVGRAAGSGIGRLSGRFGELAPPRVAWELQLRRLLAKAVTEEPRLSHRRPAGRWVAMEAEALRAGHREPVFEPGRLRDRLRPRIVVGIDSSGSISDRQLDLLAAEAGAIARRSGAETHLLGFDESVHTERRLGAAEVARALRDMPMRRGGGTAFIEVLARATALDASIAVILTDLDGPVGPAPNLPVIWAVPAPPAAAPRFGHVLVMDR